MITTPSRADNLFTLSGYSGRGQGEGSVYFWCSLRPALRRVRLAAPLLLLFLSLACSSKHTPSFATGDFSSPPTHQKSTTNNDQQTTNEKPITRKIITPTDPPILFKPTVNLSIYHLRVPLGTVPANDNFWKHAAEHALDISTYDVLYKNGLRVGL